jgi:hypothetical protein
MTEHKKIEKQNVALFLGILVCNQIRIIHKKITRYKYNFDSSFYIFGYTYRLLGCRFVWSELICVVDDKMRMVRCKICSKIKEKKKLLVPKFYSLIKHARLRKLSITRLEPDLELLVHIL